MRILVLTNLYPPHHAGTFNLRCEAVTESLKLRGHTTHVLTSKHGMGTAQRGGDVERQLLLNGVFDHPRVTRLGELKRIEQANNEILTASIADFGPDIIHVHSLEGLSKSMLFTLKHCRVPVVYDVADEWIALDIRNDPWLRWWNRPKLSFVRMLLELAGQRGRADAVAPTRLVKGYDRLPDVYGSPERLAKVPPNSISAFRFDRIYFCSQSLKETTERAGFKVSHADVIYPGIQTQRFVAEVKSKASPLKRFLVVSKLDTASGVLEVVKALAAVWSEQYRVTLSIYGRGDSDYVANARSYVATNQLPVEFLSLSNMDRDLPAIYRQHDALIYSAQWEEPFSTIPLEAMAAGLPVIGAASGGARELFRHGENALIYPPGDVGELAERMRELHDQGELRVRLAETAQQDVLSQYNETAISDRIEAYLEASQEAWQQGR